MKRCSTLIGVMLVSVALIVLPHAMLMPKVVVYNPTPSTPRGFYVVAPARGLRTGDYALIRLPEAAAQLANERGYLSLGVPLLKRVAAREGERVCVWDGEVRIEGRAFGRVQGQDAMGRTLMPWTQCQILNDGEVFLLSAAASSFDSRYFGPVSADAVLGRAIPLWTW